MVTYPHGEKLLQMNLKHSHLNPWSGVSSNYILGLCWYCFLELLCVDCGIKQVRDCVSVVGN